MGVISRSLEQGLSIGKSMEGAMNMGKTKKSSDDNMFIPLEDHHLTDLDHGDTVTAKMHIGKDGVRSLDISKPTDDESRDKMIKSISDNNNLTY